MVQSLALTINKMKKNIKIVLLIACYFEVIMCIAGAISALVYCCKFTNPTDSFWLVSLMMVGVAVFLQHAKHISKQ
jgi:hypothetical protein